MRVPEMTSGQQISHGIQERHDQSRLYDGPTDPDLPFSSQSAEKPPMDDVDKEPLPALKGESGNEVPEDLQNGAQVSWRIKVPALTCILFFTRE
jgi:hypothetical protein